MCVCVCFLSNLRAVPWETHWELGLVCWHVLHSWSIRILLFLASLAPLWSATCFFKKKGKKKKRVKGTSLIRNPSPPLNHPGHFKDIGTTEGPFSSGRLHDSSTLKHPDMSQQHLLPNGLFCPVLWLTSSQPLGKPSAMSAFPAGCIPQGLCAHYTHQPWRTNASTSSVPCLLAKTCLTWKIWLLQDIVSAFSLAGGGGC